ncbi:hypothetical protein ABB37_08816 [Leptomonas pyrrhocoris]|uniref:Amastin-like protein n=1 Tax=Leptomonas pyrrhocoris TaxID=157538 RepID=A0A0N0DS65_LEPPY|nr:hypothetical protein ABB37_08816 [Leptomonas pyrrhocoris]KPA75154.1 hypothetical protein ABB37_08816 [Leptomonas pyrrhocoris]|eukprot:XP_015653593.1 hypothetical protein ABB37_08816 [Leptomonas pyrrhocoris]
MVMLSKTSNNSKDDSGKTRPPSHHDDSDRGGTGSSTEKPSVSNHIPAPPPPPRDVLVGPILFSVMAAISLVFTVVSIGVPWYSKMQYKPDGLHNHQYFFYLFKHVTKIEGARDVVAHPSSLCEPVKRRVRVMEAFAIVSAAMTFLTFVLSVLNAVKEHTKPKVALRNAMLVITACAMGSLTIQVSFNFNVYLWSFHDCGPASSYHSQLYEPTTGFGLTVTAWVLTGLGGIIAANHLTLPLDARTVDNSIHGFTLLSLAAFLFSVVSCPISHWFYKDGNTMTVTDVLLWRERVGNFNWNMTHPGGNYSIFVKDFDCPPVQRYFRAAEAFSVISIFFSMCAGVTGLLLWKSLAGSRLPALLFSYASVVVMVVQLALELKIYYGKWCNEKYAFHKQYYVLTAGFGLMATSFCTMVVSSVYITVAYYLTEKYFPAMIPRKTAKQIAVEECN